VKWGVSLGEWASVFERNVAYLSRRVKQSTKKKALHSFQTLRTIYTVTEHHIAADLNPHQHCCENTKSHNSKFAFKLCFL